MRVKEMGAVELINEMQGEIFRERKYSLWIIVALFPFMYFFLFH